LDDFIKAVRFIYLNKTCFNGLYRVNKKGYFNTPIGSYKNPNIADEEAIINASIALQNATILNCSYEKVLNFSQSKDLIYFDPPYYPLSETSNFTSYSEFEFLDNEQNRLFEVFYKLDKQGCYVVHSNSDTEFIKNLYKNYDTNLVNANRFINSKSNGRGKISEVLIRNF
jgi:DNA adenine methylase